MLLTGIYLYIALPQTSISKWFTDESARTCYNDESQHSRRLEKTGWSLFRMACLKMIRFKLIIGFTFALLMAAQGQNGKVSIADIESFLPLPTIRSGFEHIESGVAQSR